MKAVKKFEEGCNCAQAVACHFAEHINLDEKVLLNMTAGLGGGVARNQSICGAVNGAAIVLGYILSDVYENHPEKKTEIYAHIRNVTDTFESIYSSLDCFKLLDGCSLVTEEGKELFNSGGLKSRCFGYIETIVELVQKEMLTIPEAQVNN